MILILELITLGLAVVFCGQQVKQLITIKKTVKYNANNYKAGVYEVRWH